MTTYDDDRSLREIDSAYYSKLAELDNDKNMIEAEIRYIEKYLTIFPKVLGCPCCNAHESKLKERLLYLKEMLIEVEKDVKN
jgi:hypothetical protein